MSAMLSMVLELDVCRHKRELAQAFAAARERLVQPPRFEVTDCVFVSSPPYFVMMDNVFTDCRYSIHVSSHT